MTNESNIETRQPDRMLKWFAYEHLPSHLQGVSKQFDLLQGVSKQFGLLAQDVCALIEPGPERTVALRKLLEAKDAAVRAVVNPGG